MANSKANLDDIKLIIWDLDETLWNGTISEENVKINKHFSDFIKDTLDIGIVHSICSKNDFNPVKEKLEELGLWDSFVFPSIDWTPKGARIKNIISVMNLRAVNVLFIDDNIQNLNEAEFYCKGINVSLPDEMEYLCEQAENAEKKDIDHKRLNQYKVLENKENTKSEYNSNTDFLMSCNITVEICNDCLKEADRLHELLMRSNQLNYTKFRQSKEDLTELLKDPQVNAGYVKVQDNFGDYGIVGFFAIKDDKAIHFLFSCRALGMLVEQWVYKKLGCPQIDIVGDVITKLNENDLPKWINQASNNTAKADDDFKLSSQILFKGPCDLMQIFPFIKGNDNIKTEFTYVNDEGISIEGHNHTGQIVTSLYCNDEKKQEIINEFEWFDKDMLTTALSSESFDVVILSLLADGNLGLYKRKDDGQMVSLCEAYYDLTKPDNWSKYVNAKIFTSNIKFTIEDLMRFSEKYEFVSNNDGDITVQNLDKIYNKIKAKKLILLLGSEKENKKETKPGYINRHLFNKKLNDKIKKWAENKENVVLIFLGDYIESDADYVDSINHFSKKIYYNLAKDIISNIVSSEDSDIKIGSKFVLIYQTARQKFRLLMSRLRK